MEKDLDALVSAGDAALGLIHELNNSLNSMMLQAAVVQMQVGAAHKEQLAALRQEGAKAAARLRLLQRFRDQRRQGRAELDLNDVVNEVLAAGPEWANRLEFRPAPTLPRLLALKSDLQRLVAWFLRHGLASLDAAAGPLLLLTATRSEDVCLRLRTPQPQPLEEPQSEDVMLKLEHLALETLLKETQGQFLIEEAPPEGPAILLAWPKV